MTVGVRLSRMGRNRGRNLYAEYGAPRPYMRVGEQITSGDTSSTGQTIYAGMKLVGAILAAAYGSGGGAGGIDMIITFTADFTPLGALFGKLFGVKHHEDIYGKRYTEFQVFNSKYGIPINEGDGNVRLAGNVIWTTEPKEVVLLQEQVVGDAPYTFLEYRSRSGITKDQLLSEGAQYDNTLGQKFYEYKEWHYTLNFAVAFANVKSFPAKIVRIWADKEIIWDIRSSNLNEPTQLMTVGFRNSDFHKFYKDTLITVYDGKHTSRDPTIVADKGDNTPAYKNICYAVFKGLDLNDFNGKMPIIEAEVAYRSTTVKYTEGLGTGSEGWKYNNGDVGWVHDTTDGYLIGADNYPHYYDLDIYDCYAYRSPKIFNKGREINRTGGGAGIHGVKYGRIYAETDEGNGLGGFQGILAVSNSYINRNRSKVDIWKNVTGNHSLFNFDSTKYAVYNYDRVLSVTDLYASERKAIYAYGIFGTSIASSYLYVQSMQDQGWIMPDDFIQAPADNANNNGLTAGNKIIYPTFNNQSGGLNTPGALGGLLLDRSGAYRITTDSGAFGSHGAPTNLWNYAYNGSGKPIGDSPLYSPQYTVSETGSAGILTLLEDLGKIDGHKADNGLLVIQAGGKLLHFNTILDINFNYIGIVKESIITPQIDSSSAQQLPMSGLLPAYSTFSNTGGLYRMVNCVELEYSGPDWSLAPTYQNPVGLPYVGGGVPAVTTFHWFTIMDMSATAYGNYGPLLICKYRYEQANPTLAEVVKEIILPKIPYITENDLDVATLTDIVRGYMMADTSKLVEFIERLRKGYFFDVTESDGKLKFIKRGIIDTIIDIDETLLEDPVTAIVHSVADMAKEGVLNYADWDFDFLQNDQRHRRESAKSLNIIENTLPIVFNANEAARVAYIYINGSYSEAIEIQATLDRSYNYLQCSDIISIGMFNRVRIIHITILQDGGIQIQGVTEDPQIYNTSAIGVPVLNYKSLKRLSSSKIQAFPFETPYIDYQVDQTIGYIYVPAMKRFSDSSISISVALGSDTYKYIGSTNPSKFIGRVVNRLLPPNYSVKHATWDYTNYIEFFLHQGSAPISATKAQVYLGSNRIRVGREIISFTDVELISENRYKLTGLLRGRRGTEVYTRSHNASEYIIELYDNIPKIHINEDMIGQTIFIRGKERFNNELLGSYVIRGISFAPLAPADVSAVNSGDNIDISWTRRNASQGNLIPLTEIPLGTVESYSVDILDNNNVIVRTITCSTEYCTYTDTQQIADFGEVQVSISIIVYQHTATTKGYGAYANINLVAPNYYTDFSTGIVGTQPSDITINSGTYITCTTELDGKGKKVLQLATQWAASTPDISYISLNSIATKADGDLRLAFSYDQFYGYTQGGSQTLLLVYLKGENTYIELGIDGSITTSFSGVLDDVVYEDREIFTTEPFIKQVVYNIRIQYFEEIIRVKIWDSIEPTEWLFEYFPEVISSQPDFSFNISGNVGLGTKSYSTKVLIEDVEFNDIY